MPQQERASAFRDRQAELDDLANDLKRIARSAWKRPASFALGLAGASWTYTTGDPIGALLSAGALVAGGMGHPNANVGSKKRQHREVRIISLTFTSEAAFPFISGLTSSIHYIHIDQMRSSLQVILSRTHGR